MIRTDYTSHIPQFIATLDEDIDTVARLSAEAIRDDAKTRVPDREPIGKGLIEAIHTEKVREGVWAVIAGDEEHFYGHILEGGRVGVPARPFLVPAAEAEKQHINETGRRVLSH